MHYIAYNSAQLSLLVPKFFFFFFANFLTKSEHFRKHQVILNVNLIFNLILFLLLLWVSEWVTFGLRCILYVWLWVYFKWRMKKLNTFKHHNDWSHYYIVDNYELCVRLCSVCFVTVLLKIIPQTHERSFSISLELLNSVIVRYRVI